MFGLKMIGSISKRAVKQKPFMARQGDVLIKRLGNFGQFGELKSTGRDDQDRIVLAYGEVTGHAHAIHDPGVIAYQMGEMTLLEVPETGASIIHEEHDPIELPSGRYEVTRQREWNDSEQSKWAYVAD